MVLHNDTIFVTLKSHVYFYRKWNRKKLKHLKNLLTFAQ